MEIYIWVSVKSIIFGWERYLLISERWLPLGRYGREDYKRDLICICNLLFLKKPLNKYDKISTFENLAGGYMDICNVCCNFLHKRVS